MTERVEIEWAPIIHGRTAFIDFRPNLLAAPGYFRLEDARWAKRFILGTTAQSQHLEKGPRWAMFGNDAFLVVGMAVRAAELSRTYNTELKIADGREVPNRPLFCFVGFVARRPERPVLPPFKIADFARVYEEIVARRWRQQRNDPAWEDYTGTRSAPYACEVIAAEPALEIDPAAVAIYPTSDDDRLWRVAAATRGATSVCLGVPDRSMARETPFDAVTSASVTAREMVPRKVPEPQPVVRDGEAPDRAADSGDFYSKRRMVEDDGQKKKVARAATATSPLGLGALVGGLAVLSAILAGAYWAMTPTKPTKQRPGIAKVQKGGKSKSSRSMWKETFIAPEDSKKKKAGPEKQKKPKKD